MLKKGLRGVPRVGGMGARMEQVALPAPSDAEPPVPRMMPPRILWRNEDGESPLDAESPKWCAGGARIGCPGDQSG